MMYVENIGDAKKPALILLHSGGMGGIEWQPQMSRFAEVFHVFAPDLPGHGKSVLAEGETLSISLMGREIVHLIETRQLGKAHLLGSSMGGAVALWIALNYPQVVDKLIIYRIGYHKNVETHQQTQQMANPDYWRQYGLHQWLSKLHQPQGGSTAWEQVIANVSKVLDPKTGEHQHDLSDLKRIQSQTLLIAGDSDPLIPLPTLLAMQKAIADCALWVLPQATHITATNTWRAEHFAEEVIRFLR